MSSPQQNPLPQLGVGDFGTGKDHVVEVYQQGKVIAILHKDDPARLILLQLQLPHDDPYTYVFVHGGKEVTRFENMDPGTHEISHPVVASLLATQYGSQLNGMKIRMCTCYGNMLRPGDGTTLVQRLAGLLPGCHFEGYHGLVILDASPPAIRLGRSVQWDTTCVPPGPVIVGPPGSWELVAP